LRGPAIKPLMAARAIQPTLFDDTDMAESLPRTTPPSG
jgi:hypothetical protein